VRKIITLLAVLLAVQVLLGLGLNMTRTKLSVQSNDVPVLSVDQAKLDRVTIEGPDKAKVVLAKVDGKWRLPEHYDFPADGVKIAEIVDRLKKLKLGLPVATTGEAMRRFKVNDTAFERRLTLNANDRTLAILYLGTSPSLRQTHVRPADHKTVHAIEFAITDLPVGAQDWEDKAVLQLPQTEIEAIEVIGLRFTRGISAAAPESSQASGETVKTTDKETKPAWRATGLSDGETVNVAAVETLAQVLADVRIGAVQGKEEKPGYALDKLVFNATVTRKNGEKIEYRLGKRVEGKAADQEHYTLKTSIRPEYFSLPTYSGARLIDAAKRDVLVVSPRKASESVTVAPRRTQKKPQTSVRKP
jgi:Domain of unknown function (DUF4340)